MIGFPNKKITEVIRDEMFNEINQLISNRIGNAINDINMWGASWELETEIWYSVSDFLYDT